MKLFRPKYLHRVLCLCMALHILNLSIDAPDTYSDDVPENLAINDVESITELVAENILGYTNAFPEHEERDNYDGGIVVKITKGFNLFSFFKLLPSISFRVVKEQFSEIRPIFPESIILKTLSPPPQVSC